MAGEQNSFQEQGSTLVEDIREVRHARNTDPDFTRFDAGAIIAESCVITAVHAGAELRKSAVAASKEAALTGVETFRNGLGLFMFSRYLAHPERQDSIGFLATALTFNATQELLDKHGRNGDV